ncbi:uncharacterized protein LOC129723592 isoform X2 [Wyeomyia smithii]|uniref:uncharacterized protein LOC129723592 isoform X2 n=1 Tax=Wyeomyia smithii TaxID=174621 RepID=UPI0024680976|nr:uncharacterized protein LOC129723592 isoform X2 [Wyeomyia smithii]
MEDFQTITSIHLNTIVQLPDVISWQLTERTNSWINVHWLENRVQTKLRKAETTYAQAGLDREDSYYIQACFRSLPDPTDLDLNKACKLLNDKNKENDISKRPLVYYNGHSVEQSDSGVKQFWLNDEGYSGKVKHINISEVQQWLEMPAIFVYDCDSPGRFLEGLTTETENLHLVSCGIHQQFTCPQRDLFSRVLARPVHTALEQHCVKLDVVLERERMDTLLGNIKNKKSLLGQLYWILTLLTDTIAYSALSGQHFKGFFRDDLLTGTLWRRFILAQKTLKVYACLPMSHPPLPDCSENKLWSLWDNAINTAVKLLRFEDKQENTLVDDFFHDVLSYSGEEYLPLVVEALQNSKHSSNAMDVLQLNWPTVRDNAQLLGNMMNKLTRLLISENAEIFNSSVELLVHIFRQNLALGCHLPAFCCSHLYKSLAIETNDDHILKQLFLQVTMLKHSPENTFADREVLSKFFDHPIAEIRMLALNLISNMSEKWSSEQLKQLHNLLYDYSPKVRASALRAWLTANITAVQSDCVSDKILSMILDNSRNLLMRRELMYELSSIAVEKLSELVAVSKHDSFSSCEMTKISKNKNKSKQKKIDSTAMVKVWRMILTLSSDPDPETASTMQAVVSLVKQRSLEIDAGGKKTAKKKAVIDKNPTSLSARRQPYLDQAIRELFVEPSQTAVPVANGVYSLDVSEDGPIKHQLRCFQTQRAPELIHFGPHHELAFAYRDRVVWQNFADDCSYNLKPAASTSDSSTTVSSLLFLEPVASPVQLLVGHSNGVVRVWQSNVLIAAWQAMYDLDCSVSSKSKVTTKGLLLSALGKTELVTAGDSKQLRVWDLCSEMMSADISTGTDQSITAIASQNRQNVVAGFADGSMRIFDLRTAAAGGKMTVAVKHSKSVCTISVREDQFRVISACAAGTVNVVDWRKPLNPVKSWTYDHAVSDIAIHENLQLIAGAAEALDVRTIHGEELYTVQRPESDGSVPVDGAKKRPPSSVAFHASKALICCCIVKAVNSCSNQM